MKATIKILITGIFLTLLVSACSDFLVPDGGTGGTGNVTITLDAGQAGRTVRPSNITAVTVFERIELEFSKGGGVKIVNVNKGTNSYTTTLEQGTWNINARGFMKIGDREYEAAQGSAVITVGSVSQNVGIVLQTGILGDKPGVFSYNIGFPANVTEAVLEISPLPDLHGYEILAAGKTVDLLQGKTGSFELLPGYFLLTLTAKAAATMAVWNELVHIYSGRETAASHTFAAGDFSGTLTLSGTVNGGEFEGNHITGAVVTAYGDDNFVNRIASVNVSSFTQMTAAPFYYRDSWSMTVPGSLSGKNIYFRVEETLGGPAGIRTQVWNNDLPVTVSSGGAPIELNTSYTWGKWIENGNNNAVNYAVAADGTVTVTTTETVENEWDIWRQLVSFNFPSENDIRYAYEFEAWTQSGERTISVEYINNSKYEIYKSKSFTINATKKTFTLVSEIRFDPDVRRQLAFQIGHPTITGTLYLKIKSIKPATEYVPPTTGGTPLLTATADQGGIKLKADLRGLPDELRGLMLFDEGTHTYFSTGWIWYSEHPDYYEILFPYVQTGKEYTYWLEYMLDGFAMGTPRATATATGGRGEFVFANSSELAVIKEGNTVKFNKAPVLSTFDNRNAADERYVLQVVGGTSWTDPLVEWKYSHDLVNASEPIDLIEVLQDLPEWIDISGFLGKTCFADIFYAFTYDDDDIYLQGHQNGERGVFNIAAISSTPFVYPNVLPAIFTAEPHSEGVKLSVDLNRIPASTGALFFHEAGNDSTNIWIGSYEWEEWWGSLYGHTTVEIIYPFVQPGKTYTFQVSYEGTGAIGQDTVTTTAGLGELYITNAADIGLIYSSGTKTLSLTGTPTVSPVGNSQKIEERFWNWHYYKGYNWSDSDWKGAVQYTDPITSVVFDDTFDPLLGSELSNIILFAYVTYNIRYGGINFVCVVATSPSFRFPYFEHLERAETEIRTAFDTNSNLYLNYYMEADSLYASIINYSNSYISSYAWFIDGVKLEVSINFDEWDNAYASLPTTGLSPGMHYGLVVVTIDGAAFAKEFAFRIGN